MKVDLIDIKKFNGMIELDSNQQEQVDGGLAHLYWIGVGATHLVRAVANPATRTAAINLAKSGYSSYSTWVGYGAGAGAAKTAYDHFSK